MGSSPVSGLSPSRPKRYGCETPRIYTKPLRELTPATSLGFSVIEFADSVLEIKLLPWQRWLLVHMLELLPDNSLRFRTVVVLVARQSGKSTMSQVLALWFMYVYGSRLVLGTAQDLDTAEEVWQGAVDLVTELDEEDRPIRPELFNLFDRTVMVNGKKSLNLKTGERYKVKAASRRAGRGLSGDIVLLDELREHQSWDAWGAITKTTMARAMALILCLSNAGDATSVVLRHLRKLAMGALVDAGERDLADELRSIDEVVDDELERYAEEGADELEVYVNDGDDSLAIFEWSAVPGCDVHDRDGWAQANPSLGYTITERTIASAVATDPEWIFRTEVLCQWSNGTLDGPFPPDAWSSCLANLDDVTGQPTSSIAGADRLGACVDVAADKSFAHIAFAGFNADGVPHVEVVASRSGTGWVADWLTERIGKGRPIVGVAVQQRGAPVSSLYDALVDAGLPVVEWAGADVANACGRFYDLVTAAELRHLEQPVLDIAAATAVTKPAGDGAWVWNRRQSPVDCSPLVAATGALWALGAAEQVTESAYESSDLVVL